jgi:uncharacterized membrane protein (DUF485 family)
VGANRAYEQAKEANMPSDAQDIGAADPARPDPPPAAAGATPAAATPTAGRVEPLDTGEITELARRHGRFVWPMTVFFLVYYMLLMWLPSVAPGFMGRKLVGNFTFAYLFALSQFVMTFVVAWLYSRFARRRLDPLAQQYRQRLRDSSGSEVAR